MDGVDLKVSQARTLNSGPVSDHKMVEEILETVDNTVLGVDDWNIVVIECKSLAAKWEQLSIYLGLSFEATDNIKGSGDNYYCWSEALKHWIKQNYNTKKFGEPSWRRLLAAVAKVDKLQFKVLASRHLVQELSESYYPLQREVSVTPVRDTESRDNLKIDDLMDVKSALWDARAKWRDIGRCIGVDEGTLDTMKGKDGDCLSSILSHWLKGVHNPKEKNSKPRTWCTLIEALRNRVVNEEAMASKLKREKYPDTNSDQHSTPPESGVLAATQKLKFSSSMSDEDFFKWLRSKGISDKDCKILPENGITAAGFHLCDTEDFDDIGLTKFGKKRILEAFTEAKGQHGDQQPLERDRSHDGSRGHTPQHSSQVDRRDERTISEPIHPLPALSTGPPHPSEFSKDMSSKRLADWLTNSAVGADYQEDIRKLMDQNIDGYSFKDLNENVLREFGVSFGFQKILLNIIENLKLSLASVAATPTIPTAEKQSKFDFTIFSVPKLHQLDLIEGNGKTVRVIERAAAKWVSVATRLHFESHDISRIREDYHQQTIKACQAVFIEWLEGKGRTPTTWNTVIKALEEADLSELANDLKIVFYVS